MKKVTVCVLLYGEYFNLAKQCVGSIIENFPKYQYELRVGINECCKETIDYIKQFKEIKIYEEKNNINKYLLMDKMFQDINTEFIWWFDDDTFVIKNDTFEKWMNYIENSPEDVVVWGSIYGVRMQRRSMFAKYFETSIQDWIKKQSWYNGLPIPSGNNKYEENYYQTDIQHDIWRFPTGYSWVGMTDFLKKIKYPFEGMVVGGDILLAEEVRQQKKVFNNSYYGLHVPDAPSRKKNKKIIRNKTMESKEIEKRMKEEKKININISDMLEVYPPFNYHSFYEYIAKLTNLKVFVELGSWQGDSISYLTRQIKEYQNMENVKIYSIDLFEDTPCKIMRKKYSNKVDHIRHIYEYNLAINQVRDNIITIKKDTALSANDFENNSVDFCFLDASHDYQSAIQDLKAWYPKIKKGGIISGHDYDKHHKEGIINAVDDFMEGKNVEIYPKTAVWMHKKGGGYILDSSKIKKKYILINKEFGKSSQHNFVKNIDYGVMKYLIDKYNIKNMIDIGCGLGEQVQLALKEGIKAIGVDGDHTIDIFNDKKHYILHDYTKGPLKTESFDLGWSIEFVEHVYEKYIPNYFETFKCCKKIIMTFANKGQGGYHHVNEQDPQYWLNVFTNYGFRYNKEETLMIRSIAINKWIRSKCIFFEKK